MSDYEPPAELVDALAKELWDERCREATQGCPWSGLSRENRRNVEAEARFILRRQREREHGLLEALRTVDEYGGSVSSPVARHALAAHAKLDAPKVPTLLEAAKAMVERLHWISDKRNTDVRDALKAAVEREESKR